MRSHPDEEQQEQEVQNTGADAEIINIAETENRQIVAACENAQLVEENTQFVDLSSNDPEEDNNDDTIEIIEDVEVDMEVRYFYISSVKRC